MWASAPSTVSGRVASAGRPGPRFRGRSATPPRLAEQRRRPRPAARGRAASVCTATLQQDGRVDVTEPVDDGKSSPGRQGRHVEIHRVDVAAAQRCDQFRDHAAAPARRPGRWAPAPRRQTSSVEARSTPMRRPEIRERRCRPSRGDPVALALEERHRPHRQPRRHVRPHVGEGQDRDVHLPRRQRLVRLPPRPELRHRIPRGVSLSELDRQDVRQIIERGPDQPDAQRRGSRRPQAPATPARRRE
jgi:hypothetical protein